MIFPENLPYLKLSLRPVYLPKGEPLGKDNLIFLLSNSRDESYKMVNDTTNMVANHHYKYFYYNLRYTGTIRGRKYRINELSKKKLIRKEIETKTDLLAYPAFNLTLNKDNRNTYFDLSTYMNIFSSMTEKFVASVKMNLFWNYMKSILFNPSLDKFHNRLLLVNLENFKTIKGPLKETMKNPIFILYYTLFKDYTLLSDFDIDILIYSGTYSLKINPSKADKATYRLFMVELKKLFHRISVNLTDTDLNDDVLMKAEREEIVTNEVSKALHFTGEQEVTDSSVMTKIPDKKEVSEETKKTEELEKKIVDKVEKSDDKISNIAKPETKSDNEIVVKAVKTDVENDLDRDEEIVKELYLASHKDTPAKKSSASSARDKMLREKQETLKIRDTTIQDLKKRNANKVVIPVEDVSNAVKTTNENVKKVRFKNFNKAYIENVMDKDIANAVLSLNEKSLPIYVRNIKVEDTSNELNYVDTYTFELEDEKRQRMTVKVDIPKFIDDQFMWLGGNKKLILNQNFLLPVVKSGEGEVQIVTNYNKIFIRRNETSSLGSIEKLGKLLSSNDEFEKHFTVGNAFELNRAYITTIEYDELSKLYTEFKYDNMDILFNQDEAVQFATDKGIEIPTNKLFIGMDGNNPIFIDFDTQTTDGGSTIVDLIVEKAPAEIKAEYATQKAGRRLMYAAATTMGKPIPVMVLASFWEGFENVLKKMNTTYRLTDKAPKGLKPSESVIKFADCYMIYQDNALSSLMINGIRQMKTENYTFEAMNTKDPYLDVLKKIYGKISIANALDNTYEFTIDPITLEVLKDMNLPEDIVSLMIYATRLLADNQFTTDINQGLYRIRTAEIIPAILYDSIAKNYINYKNSNGRQKLSIPRDEVIKKLLALKTVEDYSTLNPFLETARTRTVTSKGWRGINLDDSYTLEKRSYDKSMIGTIATVTSPDGQVGVTKQLCAEPIITGVRGYVNPPSEKDYKNLKDVNVHSLTELAIPLGASRDDPIRLGHAVNCFAA